MPFTHVEIEESKSRSLTLLFSFLIVVYCGSLYLLVWGVKALWGFSARPTLLELSVIFGASVAFSILHWIYSTRNILGCILEEAIGAYPADPQDAYHSKFLNITEEVSLALGGRRIQSWIIPSPASNACAVSDFNGNAAIAVTEGLLAVLSRTQLEAVIAHEAGHIAGGDSLTTSVLCSLFALHEETLNRIWRLLRERGREGGGLSDLLFRFWGMTLVLFIVVLLWFTGLIRRMAETLISREKEYRADSVAVRLTRDPLSLVEALRIVSRKWRGVGIRGESFSSIFFLDPGLEPLSEQEGWLADLFSTHPPTQKRVDLLLDMAHLDPAHLEAGSRTEKQLRSKAEVQSLQGTQDQWMVLKDGNWAGPLGLGELAGSEDLLPESWVRCLGEDRVKPAYEDPQLLSLIRNRHAKLPIAPAGSLCPKCRVSLTAARYEGVPVEKCPSCRGCFVEPKKIVRIFMRRDFDFSEATKRLAHCLLQLKDQIRVREKFYSTPRPEIPWSCPRCGGTVALEFYSGAYLVEVERCRNCELTWLDPRELELLQCLFEGTWKENPLY